MDTGNPIVDAANRTGRPARIITPQRSHVNGTVGEAGANPDSETIPRDRSK